MNMKKRYEIEVDGLPSEIAIVPSSMGLERPLLWWEWVLCLLPLAVAMPFALRYGAIGGALGGFIVVLSMITCANLLRGQKNIWLKIGCSIVNAGISILLIFVIIRIVVRLLAR